MMTDSNKKTNTENCQYYSRNDEKSKKLKCQ